jgi:hypothetical protein
MRRRRGPITSTGPTRDPSSIDYKSKDANPASNGTYDDCYRVHAILAPLHKTRASPAVHRNWAPANAQILSVQVKGGVSGVRKRVFCQKNLSLGWGLPNAATGALWEKTAEGKKKFKPG